MQGRIAVGPIPKCICGGLFTGPCPWRPSSWRRCRRRVVRAPVVMAANNHSQNHYAVLGVSRSATSADIKKAYRLLARKWHPDVSKDSQAGEVFKNIRLAYEILSNEATRIQYDRSLRLDKDVYDSTRRNSQTKYKSTDSTKSTRRRTYMYYNGDDLLDVADVIKMVYGWDPARQKRRRKRYWKYYNSGTRNSSSFYSEADDEFRVGGRGSFVKIIGSTLVFLFLVKSIGCALSLSLSSLMALFDPKLDGGYKLGYLIAWSMGGKGGVLLTLFLSFASWALGKASSGLVAVVVVAMWIGSSLASFFPIPQGALLALLYMSMKLQADLN